MRNVLLLLLAFLLPLYISAVPAKRQKITLTLSDGTKLIATFCGDEHLHYYSTEDGRTFLLDKNKEVKEVDAGKLQRIWQDRIKDRNYHRKSRSANALLGGNGNPVVGNKRGLVILVNFPDRKMLYGPEEYNDFFNKEGYSGFGMSGSVHDYFYSQSYGKLNMAFDVVGPVIVSREFAYYGSNQDELEGRDRHPAEMIVEAVTQADSLVNYADYDWDKDGFVEQVVVVYAGYSEAQAAEQPSLIWPHEWTLSTASAFGDGGGRQRKYGVIIDTYACSSELRGSEGVELDGIGTACHEFSHCLGLPDLYDTDVTDGKNFGLNLWSVMDAGVYGGKDYDGTTPVGFTSYERMFCGWLAPEVLQDPCVVTDMPALTEFPKAYILYNDSYWNEYYLLENRQNMSWDTWLPGHGMLVLHVDYDAVAWEENRVNAVNGHPRLTIIPADNHLGNDGVTFSDLSGDPYPGITGNTALTDTSVPAAMLFHQSIMGKGLLMGHPITDIQENCGMVSFVYDGGCLIGTPEALEPENITEDGFSVKWTSVEGADYYQVMLSGVLYDTEDTHYSFAGLERGGMYYYKVRAVLGDVYGEWSNTVNVDLSDITNIKDVKASSVCQIFDLLGRRVSHPGRGIYILNDRKKVMVF